jgi:hypothetical protein
MIYIKALVLVLVLPFLHLSVEAKCSKFKTTKENPSLNPFASDTKYRYGAKFFTTTNCNGRRYYYKKGTEKSVSCQPLNKPIKSFVLYSNHGEEDDDNDDKDYSVISVYPDKKCEGRIQYSTFLNGEEEWIAQPDLQGYKVQGYKVDCVRYRDRYDAFDPDTKLANQYFGSSK